MIVSEVYAESGVASPATRLVLWLVFFLISFGLGYPTLNRYNPAATGGVRDSRQYFNLVVGGPDTAEGHWRYRVLVPFLARPVYILTSGHLRSWNPISFSMLLVNTSFCAGSALMLVYIAQAIGMSFNSGLIAALSYLVNFVVVNLQLAGLVDSAECFFMMCVFLLCLRRRWSVLPLIGMLGALAKETFVALSFLFVLGWIRDEDKKSWFWLGTMTLGEMAAIVFVHSLVDGHFVTPVQIAAGERKLHHLTDVFRSSVAITADWTFWIAFLWLLPFAASSMKSLPLQSKLATLLGVIGALALSVWNWSAGDAVRPVFDVAAPCLCLGFAIGATRMSLNAPVISTTSKTL